MKNLASYPKIATLGLKIHENPYPHVLSSELKAVLGNKLNKFQELRPFDTVLRLDNGEIGVYPWDVEVILEQI